MLLSTLLLAATLSPAAQEPAPAVAPPPQEPAAMSSSTSASLDAGLAAFKKKRFSKAEIEFRKALEADPQSAAANYYLGYTYYKIAEPTRRLTPNKQKALELFDKAFELDPAFTPVWQSRK